MINNENTETTGVRPPPEGVIAGESVPRENEQVALEESRIEAVKNHLKGRGPPFTGMSDSELREYAVALIQRYGE